MRIILAAAALTLSTTCALAQTPLAGPGTTPARPDRFCIFNNARYSEGAMLCSMKDVALECVREEGTLKWNPAGDPRCANTPSTRPE